MKLIFLDMDGVICTDRAHYSQGEDPNIWHNSSLDREGIGLLNRLADDYDATYVLSSTWRTHYDQKWMEDHLRKFGWTGKFHKNWATPKLNASRGEQILCWLKQEDEGHDPFVIFDDMSKLNFRTLEANFIETDASNGISFQDYIKARKILDRK